MAQQSTNYPNHRPIPVDRKRHVEEMATVVQTEKLTEGQVRGLAGGFVWEVDDLMKLRRFVTLGSESGCYYATPPEMDKANLKGLLALIDNGKGPEAVEVLRTMSVQGRTAKQDNLLFAFGVCARSTDLETRRATYNCLQEVARIPTHLFQFITVCEKLGGESGTGWGRAARRAISKWYLKFQKNPEKLAMLVTKYRMREGWTHRDVLRLAHPKTDDAVLNFLLHYVTHGLESARGKYPEGSDKSLEVLSYLEAVEALRQCRTEFDAEVLIRQNKLVREHVPTELLNSAHVWEALLTDMPLTALIRNLGKMTSLGMFRDNKANTEKVVRLLGNEAALQRAKVHPFNVLVAKYVYERGYGEKGSLEWDEDAQVVAALEKAFYLSFKNVVPTGKRFLLALDVSGSMNSRCLGSCIKCSMASAAMAMVTMRTEENCTIMGFSHELKDLGIEKNFTLEKVLAETKRMTFGRTDCALPMTWAMTQKDLFDVFVVFTDSETYYGKVHPSVALQTYRQQKNVPDARLIVVGMSGGRFTIADPCDPLMLDMCGFDSAAPEIMRAFVEGEV